MNTRRLVITTAALCVAILAVAEGYIIYQRSHAPQPEVIQPVVFQPLTGVLADRAALLYTQAAGVSTTQPVSVSSVPLPMHKGVLVISSPAPGQEYAKTTDIPGAYAMRFENNTLCHGAGAKRSCPVAIMVKSEDDKLVSGMLMAATAVSMSVSNVYTNGNPDLLIDQEGNGYIARLWWDIDSADTPGYTALPKPEQP